jgi:transcriptional regulator
MELDIAARIQQDPPIVTRWELPMVASRAPNTRDSWGLLPGTLDLLILKALAGGSRHGYGIAEFLKSVSDDVLLVGESSLYPALQRLLLNGWVTAQWGTSDNNRRARYYTLTRKGRKRLVDEREQFQRVITAIHKVLEAG